MTKKTLSDTVIRATKPTNKDIRLFDSNGLYLIIKHNDSRQYLSRLLKRINTNSKLAFQWYYIYRAIGHFGDKDDNYYFR